MKVTMKADTFFLIIILVAMAGIIALASGFPYWQAKLTPLAVAGAVIILAVIQLIKEIGPLKASSSDKKIKANKTESRDSLHSYLLEGAWMVGFAVAIYLIGLVAAIPSFVIAYMKSHGTPWPISILVAVLLTIFCYVVFSYFLEVGFYPGIIFKSVDGLKQLLIRTSFFRG